MTDDTALGNGGRKAQTSDAITSLPDFEKKSLIFKWDLLLSIRLEEAWMRGEGTRSDLEETAACTKTGPSLPSITLSVTKLCNALMSKHFNIHTVFVNYKKYMNLAVIFLFF